MGQLCGTDWSASHRRDLHSRFLQWMGGRREDEVRPITRTSNRESGPPERRQQACPKQRGLPGSGRCDHHRQATVGETLANTPDQVSCQTISAKEPLGLRGTKRCQAWVGTFIRHGGPASAPNLADTVAEMKMLITASLINPGIACSRSLKMNTLRAANRIIRLAQDSTIF